MGADNLINFHKWQNAKKIFNEIPIVVFRRYGYNEKALKSFTSNFYKNFRLISEKINVKNFNKLPAWTIIQNKEIRISSTEIRNQREQLRYKD
jgi:nicotinate-nucleotide adenylyltransferase